MGLEGLRKEIDDIDNNIIDLLAKRKEIIKKIAKIKKVSGKLVLDKEREQQIIERLKEKSKEKGLDEKSVISLYGIILKNSRDEQEKSR